MNPIKKCYYRVTASAPRLLPRTEAEYARLKDVFVSAYGLKDEPATWATVAGQITSTPAHKVRKSWKQIANAARRLGINKLAQEEKVKAARSLQEQFEKLAEAECERLKKEESQNVQEAHEVQPQENAGAHEAPPTQEAAPVEASGP